MAYITVWHQQFRMDLPIWAIESLEEGEDEEWHVDLYGAAEEYGLAMQSVGLCDKIWDCLFRYSDGSITGKLFYVLEYFYRLMDDLRKGC